MYNKAFRVLWKPQIPNSFFSALIQPEMVFYSVGMSQKIYFIWKHF